MHPAPAETVTADADAIAQRLAAGEHEIEPPLGRVYQDSAGRIVACEIHGLPRNRSGAADAEIGAAAHEIAHVEPLGLRVAGPDQHHRCKQESMCPDHLRPLSEGSV